jgi:hypothetical protein
MARICANESAADLSALNQNRMDARCFGFRDAFADFSVQVFD